MMMLMSQHLWMETPDMGDAELFAEWLNDPEVVKYSEQRHFHHDRISQQAHWQCSGEHHLMYEIHAIDPEAPIGSIEARIDPRNNVASVGIMIGEKMARGRGYGHEAWECFCNYLIIEKKIRKIEAGCMALNTTMNKICVRYGMRLEGVIPSHFLLDGKPTDMNLYGKLVR